MRHIPRRTLAALLLGPGLLVALAAGSVGPAQAAPTCADYPAAACEGPTLALSTSVAAQGEVVDAAGAKFLANHEVTLVLRPSGSAAEAAVVTPDRTSAGTQHVMLVSARFTLAAKRSYTLTTIRTSGDGTFSTRVTAPTSARGRYEVVALNGTPAGFKDPTAPLTVTADGNRDNDQPNNDETTTAFTGVNVLWLLLLAAVLVAVGIYVMRRGRRTAPVRSIHG